MPRTGPSANAPRALHPLRRPVLLGAVVMLAYLLMALPMLARHGFDTSVFIVAGDRFVTAAETPSPIIVRPHSDGYDGQFYYRLALDPLTTTQHAAGVTLDHPAWRMQRIVLPALAFLLSAGHPALVPAALFLLNLAGLFAIGFFAMRLARGHDLPTAIPLAIVAWPGLLIALTHDTTEILAAALLLAGIAAWLRQRWAACALLLALASLTRETAILVIAGIAATQLWRLRTSWRLRNAWRAATVATLALLPFLLWRHAVAAMWAETPQGHGIAQNIGWPFAGWLQTIVANLINQPFLSAHRPRDLTMRATNLAAIAGITWFSIATTRAALRRGMSDGLAAAWFLLLSLMCLLTAQGPWVEPTAYFRAFTECFVVGCTLLGLPGARINPAWLVVALPIIFRNWELCWIQLK